MNILEIELNYLELSYIAEIDTLYSKDIFQKHLNQEKVRKNEYVKVSELMKYFKNIVSVDSRYDGQNRLLFFLQHKSENYKKFLSHKPTIKKKTLLGGKSVLLKIMNENQLNHFITVINYKHSLLPTQQQID